MKRILYTAVIVALFGVSGAHVSAQAQLIALGEQPQVSSKRGVTKGSRRDERELAKQAKAFRRTIAEGVATGAAAGFALDVGLGNDNNSGLTIGIGSGAIAGTYVAKLQRKYTRKERRLRKVRDDIRRANADLAASIATMQAVLAFQQAELAQVRASSGSKRKLRKELKQAEANLANMQRAIKGAEGWEKEFKSTRSLKLVKNQVTGIDNEIAQLSQRIAAMKNVANTLSGSIKS